LQNIIERSVIVCETENFSVDESWLLRQPHVGEPKSQLELPRKLAVQEKEMIEAALRKSGGQVSGPSGAAAKLGLPGSTLESKIRSLLLIRLFQQTPTGSVRECRGRRFRKPCANSKRSLPLRRPANNTLPPAVGRTASSVRAVEIAVLMNW